MTVSLSPLARMQFNQGGIPLAGGKLFTYAAGTTTKLATYTDSTGGTPNQNPITLDANGQCDIWLTDTVAYKFVLSPSTDTDPPTNAYWTKDNVSNIPSPTPTFTTVTVTGAASVGGNMTVGGTINKVTITQPATSATLTIANLKTLTASNTLTFSGTDGASVAFGAGGTVGYTGSPLSQFAATTSAQLLGVISDAVGTGKAVFATDPTFTLSDITTNNASTSQHGWLPKLSGSASSFLNGLGAFVGITNQRSARTTNTILAVADSGNLIEITSGSFTQTITAAATLGNGWYCYYKVTGTGTITIDPNASETIDGMLTGSVTPGMVLLIECDGAAFYTTRLGSQTVIEVKTSGTTWVAPLGVRRAKIRLCGGGGSGARTGTTGTGPSGGAGAGYLEKEISVTPGTSYTYAIGAGGVGQVSSSTVGNAGGNSTFNDGVTTYTANGGPGGSSTAGQSVTGGGTAINGDINISGGSGAGGNTTPFSWGGGTPFGPPVVGLSAASVAGSGYGCGGTGTDTGVVSGAGSPGVLILEY